MNRYDSYKYSGLEWIGEIPTNWNLTRGKFIFQNKKEINKNNQEFDNKSQNKIIQEKYLDKREKEKVNKNNFSDSEIDVKQKKENIRNNQKSKNIQDYWNVILSNIEKEDKRIYALLEKCEILSNDNLLTIDLKDEGNDFVKKTLFDKISFIKKCIHDELKKDFEIEIIYQKKIEISDEKKHPLYDKIKNKFN